MTKAASWTLMTFPFFEGFVIFTIERRRLAVRERKTERIGRVTPGMPPPFRCLLRHRVVLLKITVGVITVVVGALVFVEGLGEILQFNFRKSSKKHSRGVIRNVTHEERSKGLTIVEVWYRTALKTWLLAYSALG